MAISIQNLVPYPQNLSSNSNLKRIQFASNPTVEHGQLQGLKRKKVFCMCFSHPPFRQSGIDMKLKQTTSIFFQERFMTTVSRISSCEVNCKAKCFKIICLKQSSVIYN